MEHRTKDGGVYMDIRCYKCGLYLGEIRDATLRKNIWHICEGCARPKKKDCDLPKEFKDLFGGAFK